MAESLQAHTHQTDGIGGQIDIQCLLNQGVEALVRVTRLLPALQDQSVARRDGEARDLRQDVGSRLEDHEKDSDGDSHLLQVHALSDEGALHDPMQAVTSRGCHLTQSIGQAVQLVRRQEEAREQGLG